jgi:hypothetical protein
MRVPAGFPWEVDSWGVAWRPSRDQMQSPTALVVPSMRCSTNGPGLAAHAMPEIAIAACAVQPGKIPAETARNAARMCCCFPLPAPMVTSYRGIRIKRKPGPLKGRCRSQCARNRFCGHSTLELLSRLEPPPCGTQQRRLQRHRWATCGSDAIPPLPSSSHFPIAVRMAGARPSMTLPLLFRPARF